MAVMQKTICSSSEISNIICKRVSFRIICVISPNAICVNQVSVNGGEVKGKLTNSEWGGAEVKVVAKLYYL